MKMICIHKRNCFVLLGLLLLGMSGFLLTTHFLPVASHSVQEDRWHFITTLTAGKEKIAYLTFDDGPSVNVTPKILDILAEENIPATFFVIGKKVEEHPEIVKRAYEEGHYIANHSYHHDNALLYRNAESFLKELQATDAAIRKSHR